MSRHIDFSYMGSLDGYHFNPLRPSGLDFHCARSNINFHIKKSEPRDDRFGSRSLAITATKAFEVSDHQFKSVEALIQEKRIDPSETPVKLPYSRGGEEVVDVNGSVIDGYSVTSDFLPLDLQALCSSAGAELRDGAARLTKLLRWIAAADGPETLQWNDDPRFGLYWKASQEQYHSVPWPKQKAITVAFGTGGLPQSERSLTALSDLWDSGANEPLGHQLLREAKEIAEYNHRSSLLICHSALEVGVKQHISKCAPNSGWLMENVPSPPLFKLFRDYLPEIHCNNQDFANWSKLRKKEYLNRIDDFSKDRNKLAHIGREISGLLDEYLQLTEDFLYALDVLEGRAWAKNRVSREFASLLSWEQTRQAVTRLMIEIEQ